MMIAAATPTQRPRDARLLAIDRRGQRRHLARTSLVDLLRGGDVVVANDAATIPASLRGVHLPSGMEIEVRLAGRASLFPRDVHRWNAVVFGPGDYHTRTEDRAQPPRLLLGDRLVLGPLVATVEGVAGHPRLITLRFAGSATSVWSGLAQHGRPIQYAHVTAPLALWDVWTPFAAAPVALEAPSAGFVIDWRTLAALRARGATFVTLTLAAGLSSTGDPDLDRRLPFDEPYFISGSTAHAIEHARAEGRRIIAIGTTVVRALEHAAAADGKVRPGPGVANQRVGPQTPLRIVDAILSGTHEPDTSHYQLLRAFATDDVLAAASGELDAKGYRTHEFGDSVFIERQPAARTAAAGELPLEESALVTAA
jgi:S-adenosylmethionine:tRNA ribosyltransferase-isomerase